MLTVLANGKLEAHVILREVVQSEFHLLWSLKHEPARLDAINLYLLRTGLRLPLRPCCLDILQLQGALIPHIVPPVDAECAQFVLHRILYPERRFDWLQQEQELANLVLVEAYRLFEQAVGARGQHELATGTFGLIADDSLVQVDHLEVATHVRVELQRLNEDLVC